MHASLWCRVRERRRNISYYQCYVESYRDLVFHFYFLIDMTIHIIFRSVILISVVTLRAYLTFSSFLMIWLTESNFQGIAFQRNLLITSFSNKNKWPSQEWHFVHLKGAIMVERYWWVLNVYIHALKKGWFSYVRVSIKQNECHIYLAQLSLQFL